MDTDLLNYYLFIQSIKLNNRLKQLEENLFNIKEQEFLKTATKEQKVEYFKQKIKIEEQNKLKKKKSIKLLIIFLLLTICLIGLTTGIGFWLVY